MCEEQRLEEPKYPRLGVGFRVFSFRCGLVEDINQPPMLNTLLIIPTLSGILT